MINHFLYCIETLILYNIVNNRRDIIFLKQKNIKHDINLYVFRYFM